MFIITKFIKQECIGYSPSTKRSYYKNVVRTTDGIKTLYTDDVSHYTPANGWSKHNHAPSDLVRR